MKHIFIALFIFVSFHTNAQKFFYHETDFDKMHDVIGLHIGYLKFEIIDKVKSNNICFYTNNSIKVKIDSSNFEKFYNQKAQSIVDLDSLYFDDINTMDPISICNKIRINTNGFEFIFNPKDWTKDMNYSRVLKDTNIIIFYIDNKNLERIITSPLGKHILLYYQKYLKEIKEISYQNFATFFVDMQREMLNPKIRKYVKRIDGFKYKNLDSTMSNELSNLRYLKYSKKFDYSVDIKNVIKESRFVIDYDMDSKSGKFILQGVGFEFCPGECMWIGSRYPFYYYFIESKDLNKVFSKENVDLIYLLIDSYVNRMNCDN